MSHIVGDRMRFYLTTLLIGGAIALVEHLQIVPEFAGIVSVLFVTFVQRSMIWAKIKTSHRRVKTVV